jgi:hypothetical protein
MNMDGQQFAFCNKIISSVENSRKYDVAFEECEHPEWEKRNLWTIPKTELEDRIKEVKLKISAAERMMDDIDQDLTIINKILIFNRQRENLFKEVFQEINKYEKLNMNFRKSSKPSEDEKEEEL